MKGCYAHHRPPTTPPSLEHGVNGHHPSTTPSSLETRDKGALMATTTHPTPLCRSNASGGELMSTTTHLLTCTTPQQRGGKDCPPSSSRSLLFDATRGNTLLVVSFTQMRRGGRFPSRRLFYLNATVEETLFHVVFVLFFSTQREGARSSSYNINIFVF